MSARWARNASERAKPRIAAKLGFKNPEHIGVIEIGTDCSAGYWETYGYN